MSIVLPVKSKKHLTFKIIKPGVPYLRDISSENTCKKYVKAQDIVLRLDGVVQKIIQLRLLPFSP